MQSQQTACFDFQTGETLRKKHVSAPPLLPPTSYLIESFHSNKIAVIVGTVTDDKRILEIPKITVAALRFTEAARARIHAQGGKTLTLDQLVLLAPSGMFHRSPVASLAPNFSNL
jgi:hypothetical protein